MRILLLVMLVAISRSALCSELIYDAQGFENLSEGVTPDRWRPFHADSRPDVRIVNRGAFGSLRSLEARRTNSGGWTSLSYEFPDAKQRVQLEFSFAFSESAGRTLNLWTHEPNGKDASQFNVCIQNRALMQFDGRTRSWEVITRDVAPTPAGAAPIWHRCRAILDASAPGIDFWISAPDSPDLPDQPITRHAYRTDLPIGSIDLVSGARVTTGGWYLIDDLKVSAGSDLPAPHRPAPLPETFPLWTGLEIPSDVTEIPFVDGIQHRVIHRATSDGYKFLHGAAIIHYRGQFFANWANSPTNENGPYETLQGRRSLDGEHWSPLEIIGPGFDGSERHSHGILLQHQGELWTICSRFGVGPPARRFPGLQAEAFVWNEGSDRWESRGIVMQNCWPYDEPVRMQDGCFITGGQDKDGLPVVAVSRQDDLTQWESILIPFHPTLRPSFAETTVWAEGKHVLAVIRGGGNVAWVSTSDDCGRTWSTAAPSNFPMPRAKAYLGKLSTGQLYLVSNLANRDTLVISVGRPGETTLSRMWRIRHGPSSAPRFKGRAKGKQWSYPYAYEHGNQLYVVYSIGKEDCGLSVIPLNSLRH